MNLRLLATVLALSTFNAWGLNFKSNMQPLKLPVTIALSLPPEQPESNPGEMTVGLQRMCGDGDVANLARNNPQIEFVPQNTTKMNIVTGYWVVDGAATADADFVPTSSTFMPVAYVKDANVGNNPASIDIARSFLPINHGLSAPKNGLEILASEVVGIYKNAGRAFGNDKTYRVFSGVFTCLNMDDAGAIVGLNNQNYKYMPSTTELSNLMSHDSGLAATAYDSIKNMTTADYSNNTYPRVAGYQMGATSDSILSYAIDNNNAYKPLKVYFDKNNSSLKGQTGASTVSDSDIQPLTGTTAGNKFSAIMNLNFPNLSNAPISATRPTETTPATQADLDSWVTLLPSTVTPPALNDPITSDHLAGWDATHPTDADKVVYLQTQITNWKSSLGITAPDTLPEQIAVCNSLNLQTNTSTKTYKWEVFPMNTSCKKLFNNDASGSSIDSTTLSATLAQLFPMSIGNSSALVNYQNNFFKYKKALAIRFFVANALEVVQRKANDDSHLKISHANCFNTNGKPLITRLIGSYPLRFNRTAGVYGLTPNPLNHIHPEPLFALHDWDDYKNSDMLGLWGQVVSRQPTYAPGAFAGLLSYGGVDISSLEYGSIDLASYTPPEPIPVEPLHPVDWGVYMPVNDKTQLNQNNINGATFKGPAINILFKIRSIGGNCPGFC